MRKKASDFRMDDVLSGFRSLETNEDALVVLGDEQAMRVLIAWTHTDQTWTQPEAPAPLALHGRMGRLWKWLVSGWDIDSRELGRLAGVASTTAHEKIEMLIGNRLIYPDGSMAKGLKLALTAYTAKKLGFKAKAGAMPKEPAKSIEEDDKGGN